MHKLRSSAFDARLERPCLFSSSLWKRFAAVSYRASFRRELKITAVVDRAVDSAESKRSDEDWVFARTHSKGKPPYWPGSLYKPRIAPASQL